MSLNAGARLGPYEILASLGAGGMGEVYRARDARLERTVAVKVLPARFAASPELRQRFEREARAVAALSHPHICALYDVGSQEGIDYLVMEYLEGETAAQRLALSPDGRWLAYNSNETGGTEVYIQSFPPSGAKWQISTGGGSHPRWRRDGKELYCLAGDQKIMAVEIRGATTLEPGQPRPLFQARGSGLLLSNLAFPYTVTGDGRRFLVNSNTQEGSAAPVVLAVNWTAGLRR